jgi:elongation factor P
MEGQLVTIVGVEHIKLARAGAVIKAKLRNIRTGAIFEQSFRSGDKFKTVRIEKSAATYLYSDGDLYHFMDSQTYDQVALSRSAVEDVIPYLKEGNPVNILRYEDSLIGVELPITVDLQVVDTEPGFKGDTVGASFKPARVETGASVPVPLFVNKGDVIKVDTRTGTYMERV